IEPGKREKRYDHRAVGRYKRGDSQCNRKLARRDAVGPGSVFRLGGRGERCVFQQLSVLFVARLGFKEGTRSASDLRDQATSAGDAGGGIRRPSRVLSNMLAGRD